MFLSHVRTKLCSKLGELLKQAGLFSKEPFAFHKLSTSSYPYVTMIFAPIMQTDMAYFRENNETPLAQEIWESPRSEYNLVKFRCDISCTSCHCDELLMNTCAWRKSEISFMVSYSAPYNCHTENIIWIRGNVLHISSSLKSGSSRSISS